MKKAAALLLSAAAVGVGAGTAQAQVSAYKFFGKQTSSVFTTASGKRVSQNAGPKAGDELFSTSNLYPGTAANHAKDYTATAALTCVFTRVTRSGGTADCVGVIAIGSSMLVSQSVQTFSQNGGLSNFPITGGTGIYLHARGSVHATPVGKNGNNTNFVIHITT